MTTLEHVVATGAVLLVFVVIANVIVDLYARGAVRAAVDEAVRVSARVDATSEQCAARAADVLAGLLGERLRAGIRITCSEGLGAVTATAEVRLAGWLPVVPDWSFVITGTAVEERVP
jgi:hypothetical protein